MKIITMKKHFLFLLFLTPLIINTSELDYRLGLKKAIVTENEEGVKSILKTLRPQTIPEVLPITVHSVNSWTKNPIFLDTNPNILRLLIDANVSINRYDQVGTFARFPVEEHHRYENIALLLSKGSPYSKWHTLQHAINKKKDPRIICALLISGAPPLYDYPGMQYRGDHPIHVNCFNNLREQINESIDPTHNIYQRYFIALTIAQEKQKNWKNQLLEMIEMYRYQEQTEPVKPLALQLRERSLGKKFSKKDATQSTKIIFEHNYKEAYSKWLQERA